jgi:hypothetical protein
MAKTFYALMDLANLNFESTLPKKEIELESSSKAELSKPLTREASSSLGLQYNIQIHLPATKDVEVYNAIFKSLKNHLIELEERH